jgi:phospholipid N-methyltransferase
MTIDSSIIDDLADPDKSQWFLTSPDKIQKLIQAADIRPGDRVIEIGGGIGTITAHIPSYAQTTSTELDEEVGAVLKQLAPEGVEVVVGNGLEYIETHPFDVLISSLPTELAEQFIRDQLLDLAFRTAIVAIEPDTDVDDLPRLYQDVQIITTAEGDDYRPFQPCVSRFVKLGRPRPGRRNMGGHQTLPAGDQ